MEMSRGLRRRSISSDFEGETSLHGGGRRHGRGHYAARPTRSSCDRAADRRPDD